MSKKRIKFRKSLMPKLHYLHKYININKSKEHVNKSNDEQVNRINKYIKDNKIYYIK